MTVALSATVIEGSPVTLTCNTDAKPEANYTWYKEEQRGHELSEHRKQLVFTFIQPSDSGSYYCQAENQLGFKRSNSTLVNVTCESSCSRACCSHLFFHVRFHNILIYLYCKPRKSVDLRATTYKIIQSN